MPVMDGLQATTAIIKVHQDYINKYPESNKPKPMIYAMTAHSNSTIL